MGRVSLWLSRLLFARSPRPYDVHRELWRAFPGHTQRPFLFRADGAEGRRLRVLVQSFVVPEWTRLAGALEEASGPNAFAPAMIPGARFRFFLRANPTRSRKDRGEPKVAALEGAAFRAARGVRRPILAETERVEWLKRQGDSAGFALAAREDGTPILRLAPPFSVEWRNGGPPARHDGVDFEGVLRVDDPAAFARALANGIGSAKAFGFGLLSVGAL